jgi:outer membrane protein insertion porin family
LRWLGIYVAILALLPLVETAEARDNTARDNTTQDAAPRAWTFQDCDQAGSVPETWPAEVPPGDTTALEIHLRRLGFLDARVDTSDSRAVCLTRGRRYSLATRVVSGLSSEEAGSTLERDSLGLAQVDSLMRAFLEQLEAEGRIRSSVSIDSFQLVDGQVGLGLKVVQGQRAVLLGLLVGGRTRTSLAYLQRVTGLREGDKLSSFDAARLRASLRSTGLFERVEEPILLPTSDSTAIVQLVLDDRAPGSFDLALGYLPAVAGRAGTVVGSGSLVLRNLFGGGRAFAVELDRLPGQASSFEASLADPFVLGQDLGAEASFSGYQQDSTFSRQEYRLRASLGMGLARLTATATRRVARPGVAGARIVAGRQAVASSASRMAGFGVSYHVTDAVLSPSRGLELDLEVLRGRNLRHARVVTNTDTLRVERSLLQDRLEARIRWYLPAGGLTLALGADLWVLVSDEVDASDLYRLGGASTLRGYDEDRFAGSTVGRALIELRRRLEGPSYAYLFADFGYVDSGTVNSGAVFSGAVFSGEEGGTDVAAAVHPGFGAGIQIETGAGLLNISYAVNREEGPLNGRIHFGIAFGL